jgi:hypothetical protein
MEEAEEMIRRHQSSGPVFTQLFTPSAADMQDVELDGSAAEL